MVLKKLRHHYLDGKVHCLAIQCTHINVAPLIVQESSTVKETSCIIIFLGRTVPRGIHK